MNKFLPVLCFMTALLAALPALAQEVHRDARNSIAQNGTFMDRLQYMKEASRSVEHPWGVWTSFGYNRVENDVAGEEHDLDFDTTTLGADHRWATPAGDVVLGLAASYTSSEAVYAFTDSVLKSNGHTFTAYGSYSPNPYFSFPVSISYSDWNSRQRRDGTVLMPVYTARYNSDSIATSIGAAVTIPLAQDWLMTTQLRHNYAKSDREAYTEAQNPAGTSFQVTPGDSTYLSQAIADVRMMHSLGFMGAPSGNIYLSGGYSYDLHRAPDQSGRVEYPLGAGISYMHNGLRFGLDLQSVVGRTDVDRYGGRLSLRYVF